MGKSSYTGRLAFDPETGYHLGEGGQKVVSEDGGKSWREAGSGDPSHIERYHQRHVGVDSTGARLAELAFEHGEEQANALLATEQPHHFEVQPDDPQFDGVKSDPDVDAPTITSHTEAQ